MHLDEMASVHNNLGVAYSLLGRHAKAREQFRRALRIQPSNVDALFNLANVLLFQGRRDQAASRYREVLRLDPSYRGARRRLKRLEEATGDAPSRER